MLFDIFGEGQLTIVLCLIDLLLQAVVTRRKILFFFFFDTQKGRPPELSELTNQNKISYYNGNIDLASKAGKFLLMQLLLI